MATDDQYQSNVLDPSQQAHRCFYWHHVDHGFLFWLFQVLVLAAISYCMLTLDYPLLPTMPLW